MLYVHPGSGDGPRDPVMWNTCPTFINGHSRLRCPSPALLPWRLCRPPWFKYCACPVQATGKQIGQKRGLWAVAVVTALLGTLFLSAGISCSLLAAVCWAAGCGSPHPQSAQPCGPLWGWRLPSGFLMAADPSTQLLHWLHTSPDPGVTDELQLPHHPRWHCPLSLLQQRHRPQPCQNYIY